MGRTGVAPAGDRNVLGHLPGTEPGSCRGRILRWTGLFWCLKGYFGVYRGILGCVTLHREWGAAGRDFRVDTIILVPKGIF